jgi:phosphoglycerate kinase
LIRNNLVQSSLLLQHCNFFIMKRYKTLADMPPLAGKRVLVRSELNVPIVDGVAGDQYRIEMALPTLKELLSRGAKVIVVAHIGRKPEETLAPVYQVLRQHIPNTQFVSDVVGELAQQAVAGLQNGDLLLLENLRSHSGEATNEAGFADALAQFADYYVDDAFGAAHRAHASIVGVPSRIPGFAGLLLERELAELADGLTPQTPSLFILGGAKFDTKVPLLTAALARYDTICIGGALANDFIRAQGYEVGTSLVSEEASQAPEFMATGKLMIPVDVLVEGPEGVVVKHVEHIGPEDRIVDIGPETITELGVRIAHAKTTLWNGPLGYVEGGFTDSTRQIAQLIADAPGHSLIGGGDTVAAIRTLGLADSFSFLSTGGGAMLEYLIDGTLPGVEALTASL